MTQNAAPGAGLARNLLRKPAPLGVRIADQLRRDILFGTLTPDIRMTQEQICERFGTSRVPVRDALQTLLSQGLIEETPRGLRPVRLTESDLADMFHVEGMLHALATRYATERSSPDQIDELERLNAGMELAYDAKNFAEMSSVNAKFHRQINMLANSPRLIAALRVTTLRIQSNYLERFPERASTALNDHRAIVRAIRAGEADEASNLMLKHVMSSARTLNQAISSVRRGEQTDLLADELTDDMADDLPELSF
jgi:DNA-binding GntR family transcriptional regulator